MKERDLRVPVGAGDTVGATAALPDVIEVPLGVLLAHGAGNDRFAPLLAGVQHGLARRGVLCVTFNFLYKEQGRRVPDPLPVLVRTYAQALAFVRGLFCNEVEGWAIGGKSLGGRVASHLAADGEAAEGLVLLGYPLHPAGKPEQLRVEHLRQIRIPMLFIQGTRDSLCDLAILRSVLRALQGQQQRPVELVVIEGGDHSFVVPRALGETQEEVYESIVLHILAWLKKIAAGRRNKP
ncbi:MAG: dienelactone hydrolase family protein [Candidatus Binatia bacterium]|nr:dienelactone hydrolase family protein [Candidatus Binatia bacterium]